MGEESDKTLKNTSKRSGFNSFDVIRTLLLFALAGIVALFDPSLNLSRPEWAFSVGAIIGLILSAVATRAWGLAEDRTLAELHELFFYLIAGLILAAAVLFLDQTGPFSTFLDLQLTFLVNAGSTSELHATTSIDWRAMSVAGVLFFLNFLPLVLAILRIEARQKAEQMRPRPILRDDIVSVPSLVIGTVIVGFIFALAWAAGSGRFELGQQINVLTMITVVGGFLALIFIPNMVRAWNDWLERRTAIVDPVAANGIATVSHGVLSFAARGASYFDSIVVRIFAPLSGATQTGFMVPHLLVILVIVPLSAMGFILAPPYGLLPIGLAALIAFALGRRWAWVEDDRETASRLQSTDASKADIKVGFDNDLKDEALLGYASLFVLVPLALYQVQGAMTLFETTEVSTGNPFFDWLSFFGAELAKAVPFVDWWEIYNVDVDVPFKAIEGSDGEWARHLTFGARALVDLVIMAALFQALTIWQRSRTQRKLFTTGELNAFDPFTEEEFFERGMHRPFGSDTLKPKRAFRQLVQGHVDARRNLNLDPLPYSRERLGELIKREQNDDLKLGAEWMIRKYDVLAGEPRAQLRQLAQRWSTLEARHQFQGSDAQARAWIREQKRELERILDLLLREADRFRGPQIGCLAQILDKVRRRPEMAYARLLSFELLDERATGKSAALLGCHLVRDSWPQELRENLKRKFAVHLGFPYDLYLGNGHMRTEVLKVLVSQYPRQGIYAKAMIRDLLSGVAQYDGNSATRDRAAASLQSLD